MFFTFSTLKYGAPKVRCETDNAIKVTESFSNGLRYFGIVEGDVSPYPTSNDIMYGVVALFKTFKKQALENALIFIIIHKV